MKISVPFKRAFCLLLKIAPEPLRLAVPGPSGGVWRARWPSRRPYAAPPRRFEVGRRTWRFEARGVSIHVAIGKHSFIAFYAWILVIHFN